MTLGQNAGRFVRLLLYLMVVRFHIDDAFDGRVEPSLKNLGWDSFQFVSNPCAPCFLDERRIVRRLPFCSLAILGRFNSSAWACDMATAAYLNASNVEIVAGRAITWLSTIESPSGSQSPKQNRNKTFQLPDAL